MPEDQSDQYIQGGTVTYPGGESSVNPYQFATDAEARRLAALYGGTVSQSQLSGLQSWSNPMNMINVPGGASPLNAGLVSRTLQNSPGEYGRHLVQRDITGDYSAASDPWANRPNPSANSQQRQNIINGLQAGQYVDPAYAATFGIRTTGRGYDGEINPSQGRPAANASSPNPSELSPYGSPGAPPLSGYRLPTAGQRPTGVGGSVTTRPRTNPATAFQRPSLSSSTQRVAPRTSALSNPYTRSSGGAQFDLGSGQGEMPSNMTEGGDQGTEGGSNNFTGGEIGYPRSGSGRAPNAAFPQFADIPFNPYASDPYDVPGARPLLADPNGYGEDLQYKAENDRAMAIQQGLGLQYDLSHYSNYQQARANNYETGANSAYSGIAAGYGGYSDEEMAAIQNQPGLDRLQLGDDEANSNYLNDWEQAGIYGDPNMPIRQLGLDEQNIDAATNSRYGAVRGALDSQDYGIERGLQEGAGNLRNAIYGQRGVMRGNLSDIAALTRYQQGNAENNVRGALNYGEDTARSFIDPERLRLSNEYQQNYNVSDRDMQNIRDRAGRAVGSQTAMDEQRLMQAANTAGNTNPLALASARAQLRHTGAVNSANAMSDADIQARRLQLDTTQQREQTRLGAEGNLANLGTGTELALGSRRYGAESALGQQGLQNEQYMGNISQDTERTLGAAEQGAEQYLSNQRQQAEQYRGGARVGAEQTLGEANTGNQRFMTQTNLGARQNEEQQQSERARYLAANRQQTGLGNQAQRFQRGQYIYGQGNQNRTNFANQRRADEAEYRGYLTGQGTQANQNAQVGTQQRLSAYGTQLGGQNTATRNAIENYRVPGLGERLAGQFLAKGGVIDGPQKALVGENGPELIVSFGMPHYDEGTDGVVAPYDPYGGNRPDMMTGPRAPQGQIAQTATMKRPNPFYEAIKRGLVRPSSPTGEYQAGDYPSGGGSGIGKQIIGGLVSAGLKALIPAEQGAVVAPQMEMVDRPQVRTLGERYPQAVVPLTRRPGNKVNLEDIPRLTEQYSSYGV